MLLQRLHRTPLAALALLLFLLVTLTPTVGRTLVFMQGQTAPWATLCASGDRGGRGGAAEALQHLTAHCPACHLQADHLLPLPATAAGLAAAPVAWVLPGSNPGWQLAGPAWALAQPRAPPRTA
ncbi:MAG: DUF2946 family protein [Aquabacterium sp.]|nr:DUF2946 family protein [Aquabacterium sp.]